jgi:hypothetical protein
MTHVSSLAFALVLACSSSSSKPAASSPASESAAAPAEADGYRDQMCGCKKKSGDRAIREDCAAGVESAWKTASKQGAAMSSTAAAQFQACRDDIRKGFEAMQSGGGW